MRVALDCRMATWTGVGRYTIGLARALAARPDIELAQIVAAGEEPPASPEAARGPVVVARRHPFAFDAAADLARAVAQAAPDVTHCAHFLTPVPASHPLVVTMHDLTPLLVPGIMRSAFRRGVYRFWNARAVRTADALITDSRFSADEIARVFPAAEPRLTAIPLGVDDFAEHPAEPLSASLAALAADGAPYLLSMGSTRPHKDVPTLLRAFARIATGRPDLRLLLVGADVPGYLAENLASAPDTVRERVAFTGRVSDGELRTLMSGASAFAFPSRYEGFGLPPLEAMALGAPVVVAEAASLPEVVGDAALRFSVGDDTGLARELERVLSDDALREHLSAAGLARAANFTWARTAEATFAIYQAAIERARA